MFNAKKAIRTATGIAVAATTLAIAPLAVAAACGDPAGDGVDWSGCDMSGTDQTGATLTNANLTLTNLGQAILTNANLSGAEIFDTDFISASGANANFTGATQAIPGTTRDDYRSVEFTNANFAGANFTNANLRNAYFYKANLSGANFTGADILAAVFVGADLTDATFDLTAVTSGFNTELQPQALSTNFMYTPAGAPDAATTAFETAKVVNVLANDENFNTTNHGRTFMPVQVSDPAHGSVVVNGNGTITYTPDAGFSGVDSFTYRPQSVLPADWALPTGVSKTSTGAAVTVTITVQAASCSPVTGDFVGRTGIAGRIVRLYAAYFYRNPDISGYNFWFNKISAGQWTNAAASNFFSSSPEFIKRYGASLTDEQFLIQVYGNMFCRLPDAGGKAYWLGRMATDLTRGQAILLIADSPEYRKVTQTN